MHIFSYLLNRKVRIVWIQKSNWDHYYFEFHHLNSVSPLLPRIVPHSEIDPRDHYTISLQGITHNNTDEVEFTKLGRWEKEYRDYQSLVKIPTFFNFRKWKAFVVWRQNVRGKWVNLIVLPWKCLWISFCRDNSSKLTRVWYLVSWIHEFVFYMIKLSRSCCTQGVGILQAVWHSQEPQSVELFSRFEIFSCLLSRLSVDCVNFQLCNLLSSTQFNRCFCCYSLAICHAFATLPHLSNIWLKYWKACQKSLS